jgi:hypothetical protein
MTDTKTHRFDMIVYILLYRRLGRVFEGADYLDVDDLTEDKVCDRLVDSVGEMATKEQSAALRNRCRWLAQGGRFVDGKPQGLPTAGGDA